jgi:uncharacterized protein (TIGR02453 family)
MPATRSFTPALYSFLDDLEMHNERPWFKSNQDRYDRDVKEPALRFITDFASHLRKISPHFVADPRPVGGSMFRIHRDTRFAKDKTPYKTHTGIQFRHEAASDAHAPGFYLHLEPGGNYAGMGVWRPDTATARAIRQAILDDPAGWRAATRRKPFTSRLELSGDSLKRPPAGVDPDHPLIDDVRRKDFVAGTAITQKMVTGPGFLDEYFELCKAGAPFVRFLCGALGLPF